ncbi:MAG: Phosphoribosyl transferase domain, partial [Pseudomonadota bacterium]
IQGRQVAVIDDIMTTGASLQEAARALLQAGASRVVGVVLARTPEVS